MTRLWRVVALAALLFVALTARAEFEVVVGSYTDRAIAIRELRSLAPDTRQLFIRVDHPSKGDTSAAQVRYRVVSGPFVSYQQALAAKRDWGSRGAADAWVAPVPAGGS